MAKTSKRVLKVESLEARDVPSSAPLTVLQGPVDLGPAIERGNSRYDLQPTILLDTSDTFDGNGNGIPDRLYKMWWLGRHEGPGAPDLAPAHLDAGDRIYYAFSENGTNWSTPVPVIKGQAGTNPNFTADDHLVGSPSVLKVGSTFTMFYEAYSTWVEPINRFYSFSNGDNWITNSRDLPGGNYALERHLGFAPLLAKAGTRPIYSGVVTYANGKTNSYLTPSLPFVGTKNDGSVWAARNRDTESGKIVPVFWLYESNAPGRKPIYSFFDPVHSNTYASDSPTGDGVPGAILVEKLGYAAATLNGPDTIGANQNRVIMATSTDGMNWTRFQGPARGGAVIAPQDELVTAKLYNPNSPILNNRYGSGYPSALIRDGHLELYFTDEVPEVTNNYVGRRIRMPVSDMYNTNAWKQVRSGANNPFLTQSAPHSIDLKWSPLQQRYFTTFILTKTPGLAFNHPNFRQSSTILWTDANPGTSAPPTFPANNMLEIPSPGRNGIWGGILGTGLGHTIDLGGAQPATFIQAYYESYAYGTPHDFGTDISHAAALFTSAPAGSLGSVSGNVYHDLNRNGKQDSGENGVGNRIVYRDTNNNNRRDPGEPFTVTAANGAWKMDLPAGTHRIRIDRAGPWDITQGFHGYSVQVAANTATSNVRFGVAGRTPDLMGTIRSGKTWFLAGDQTGSGAAQSFALGQNRDHYFAADWNGDGKTDLIIARPHRNTYLWLIDTDGDRIPDMTLQFGRTTGTPIVGDWDGNGTFDPGFVVPNSRSGLLDWYLNPGKQADILPAPRSYGFRKDIPVVGDWDGNGITDLGVARRLPREGVWHWLLDVNGDAYPDITRTYGLLATGDVPIVGDWDGNGITDLGVTRNDRKSGLKVWLLDTNGDTLPDITQSFGFHKDRPIVGNWKKLPVAGAGVPAAATSAPELAVSPTNPLPADPLAGLFPLSLEGLEFWAGSSNTSPENRLWGETTLSV